MKSYRTTVELAEPPVDDTTLLAKLVPVLAQGAPPAAVAAVLGLDRQITEAAIKTLLELGEIGRVLEPDSSGLVAAPLRAMRKQNLLRSGAYLLNAARRLSTGAGQSLTGVNPGSFRQAWDREQTYLDQHLQARANRTEAAQAVTAQVRESGSMLVGWYSKLDEKTSVECRAAHGRNFRADQIPLIGLPGAVHPHCRCRPGPAHDNARLVGGTSPSPVPGQVMADASAGRQLALSVLDLGVKVTRSGGRHRKPEEEPSVFWGIVESTGGTPAFRWKTEPDTPESVELADSRSYPNLERVPGKQNWVDKAGGLPSFIERIAKHLHYEKGYEIGRAIAVAVNTCRRWAAGGTVTEHGSSHGVSAETRAKAVAALASWEAKKARGKG